MPQSKTDNHWLALDIGDSRIGVAVASETAKLPRSLITLANDSNLLAGLQELVEQYRVSRLVVGLPRGLNGQETAQTRLTRKTTAKLAERLDLKVYWSDETLSSQRARDELIKHRKPFTKGDVDALAAVLILEDYISGEIN